MSGLKPYPEYKESGVGWLGRTPSDWGVHAVRYAASCLDYLRIPKNSGERSEMQGDIPYWGANNVQDHVNRALVHGPVVLVGEDGAPFLDPIAAVSFAVDGPLWPNNHIHVLRARAGFCYRFLSHCLNAVDYSLYLKGSTRDKLNQAELMSIVVPVPPLEEQTSIADFLDRETAEIDAFIADQEELITLLAERRAATVAGMYAPIVQIDEAAPLKRSVRVQNAVSEIDDRVGRAEAELLSVSIHHGVVPWSAIHDKLPIAENFGSYKSVRCGDVVLNRMRAFQGAVGVANQDGMVSPDYAVFRCRRGAESAFVGNLLRSAPFVEAMKLRLRGIGDESTGTIRTPRINSRDLLRIRIVLPSTEEQLQIVERLVRETAEIDAAIADARDAIALSRERRASLISAAVTGKIDVRDEARETT